MYPCFFFLQFQLFMRNHLSKLTKILQFQKTNNADRFYGKKQVENPHTIFLSDSILLLFKLENKILRFIRKSRFYSNRLGFRVAFRYRIKYVQKNGIEVFDLFFAVESIRIVSFLRLQNFC